MNSMIFVSIVCIGNSCSFFSSSQPITEIHCQQIKTQFLALPFKPEITLAAAQCMKFNEGEKV